MRCSDLQVDLTLFADGVLGESKTAFIVEHLTVCPLCRQKYHEYSDIRSSLGRMRRPEMSDALRNSIKSSIRAERRYAGQSWIPISSEIRNWLQMRVMPLGVGVFTSLLVGVTFLTIMFSGFLNNSSETEIGEERRSSVMLAANFEPLQEETAFDISATDFANSRMAFSNESPSVNPQGALIALTKSLVRGGMRDDEVVVVADVFGNGLARISEVVEPSRDSSAVGELEKALNSGSASTPFVPSVLENRPENVRVVLRIQNVYVSTGTKSARRRS